MGKYFAGGLIHRYCSTALAPERHDILSCASAEAKAALEGFQNRFKSHRRPDGSSTPVSKYWQTIDGNQVHLLRLTLANMVPLNSDNNSDDDSLRKEQRKILSQGNALKYGLPEHETLLPTEHLCFFTPRVPSDTLGADGSDTSFNPPGGVFTRRMWAGGEMTWKGTPIRIGDRVWEKTYVEDVQLKRLGGSRGEMIVVWVRKEFGTDNGLALVDKRSWVFQKALSTDNMPEEQNHSQSTNNCIDFSQCQLVQPTRVKQYHADLFRYSALTFNAHAIHLSPLWARQVEGHKNTVVHGPLNLSLLVRKWCKDVAGWRMDNDGCISGSPVKRKLVHLSYRAKKPVYAESEYVIGFEKQGGRTFLDTNADAHKVVAQLSDGSVAMEATIRSMPLD